MKILFKLFVLIAFSAINTQLSAQAAKDLSLAEKFFKRQDYYSAFEYYDRALNSKTSSINNEQKRLKAQYNFAECARITYHFRKAEEAYGAVAKSAIKDNYPKLDFYYAYTLKHNGKYDEAGKAFAAFAQKAPANDELAALKRHAEQEIIACELSKKLMAEANMKLKITSMEAINTKYSDFAPHEVDNELYYSSLKFERERRVRTSKNDAAENYLVGKLMRSKDRGKKTGEVVEPLSEKYINTGNSTISPDGKFLIFTKCVFIDLMTIRCKLYVSFRDEKTKKWSEPVVLPEPVNGDKFTTTHPSIGFDSTKMNHVLFFISDREGGQGAFDVWECEIINIKGNQFTTPINLGTTINSVEEEVTPHFNTSQQCLYFSSKWHPGLGGYDIFRTKRQGSGWATPENIGVPLNSAANDMYFIVNSGDTTGYFASNRPGSKILMGESCCNDIYAIAFPKPEPPAPVVVDTPVVAVVEDPKTSVDTTPTVVAIVPPVDTMPVVAVIDRTNIEVREDIPLTNINDTEETLAKLNKVLPISLYFHNDEPDPRTRNTTTTQTYQQAYQKYMDLKDTYRTEHPSQFSGELKINAERKIDDFFNNHVEREYNRMHECFDLLIALLERGETLEIQLRGFTSARAKTDYNKILASRRISSVRNEIESYRNGAMKSYVAKGQLIITELPLGETEAVSSNDDKEDARNSVYGVDAAKDRRVEIQKVQEKK